MSPIGTFRKCHLRRVKAALGSTADSGKPPEGREAGATEVILICHPFTPRHLLALVAAVVPTLSACRPGSGGR